MKKVFSALSLAFTFSLLSTFTACNGQVENNTDMEETTTEETTQAETTVAPTSTADDFFDFVSSFPDEMRPLDISKIESRAFIEEENVTKYIDSNYAKLIASEEAEADASEEGDEEYYPLKYIYGARLITPTDLYYCIVYWPIREGIGAEGQLAVATFTPAGKLIAKIEMDASSVISTGEVSCTIRESLIEVKGGETEGEYLFTANGNLKKK